MIKRWRASEAPLPVWSPPLLHHLVPHGTGTCAGAGVLCGPRRGVFWEDREDAGNVCGQLSQLDAAGPRGASPKHMCCTLSSYPSCDRSQTLVAKGAPCSTPSPLPCSCPMQDDSFAAWGCLVTAPCSAHRLVTPTLLARISRQTPTGRTQQPPPAPAFASTLGGGAPGPVLAAPAVGMSPWAWSLGPSQGTKGRCWPWPTKPHAAPLDTLLTALPCQPASACSQALPTCSLRPCLLLMGRVL